MKIPISNSKKKSHFHLIIIAKFHFTFIKLIRPIIILLKFLYYLTNFINLFLILIHTLFNYFK
jgi:hypothetical protein